MIENHDTGSGNNIHLISGFRLIRNLILMDQSASIDLGQSYQCVVKISVPPLDILVSKECLGQTVSTWEKLVCMLATKS